MPKVSKNLRPKEIALPMAAAGLLGPDLVKSVAVVGVGSERNII